MSVTYEKLLIPLLSAAVGGLIAAFFFKPVEIDYQTLVRQEIAAFEQLADALVERYHPAGPTADTNARRLQHRANIMLAMYGFPSQLLAHEAYLMARHWDSVALAEKQAAEQLARGVIGAPRPRGEFLFEACTQEQRIIEDVRIYSLWRRQLFRGVWSARWFFDTADRFADDGEERRVLALLVHNCRLSPTGHLIPR